MIIVMTGATSGIGAEALKNIAHSPENKIYVGARGKGRVVPDGVEVLPLELSSLSSVREIADALKQRVTAKKIDVLTLDAAMRVTAPSQLSEDGVQITFTTIHVAHYLLASLLWSLMEADGRIVI